MHAGVRDRNKESLQKNSEYNEEEINEKIPKTGKEEIEGSVVLRKKGNSEKQGHFKDTSFRRVIISGLMKAIFY